MAPMRSGHPSPAGLPDVDVVRSRLASSPTWSLPDRFGHSSHWRFYQWSVLAVRLMPTAMEDLSSVLFLGRRPRWWEPWCSWAKVATQGWAASRHGRVGGVVVGVSSS